MTRKSNSDEIKTFHKISSRAYVSKNINSFLTNSYKSCFHRKFYEIPEKAQCTVFFGVPLLESHSEGVKGDFALSFSARV